MTIEGDRGFLDAKAVASRVEILRHRFEQGIIMVKLSTLLVFSALAVAPEPGSVSAEAPVATSADAAASPVPPSQEQVRANVTRSLAFLEQEGLKWKEEKKCASCHHIPFMVWAMSEAAAHSYQVNTQVLQETTAWLLTNPEAKILPAADETRPDYLGLSLATIYSLLATTSEGDPNLAASRLALGKHVTDRQDPVGKWELPKANRAPLSASAQSLTFLAMLGLPATDAVGQPLPTVLTGRERANAWLAAEAKEDTNQTQALRLMYATRAQSTQEPATCDPALVPALVDQILARQNADGGWSQTPEMPSDAYATGQSLSALGVLRLEPSIAAIDRARQFLLSTQLENGSWTMTSRPMPDKPDDKGANNLAPITYAGTAWATIGLIKSAPK